MERQRNEKGKRTLKTTEVGQLPFSVKDLKEPHGKRNPMSIHFYEHGPCAKSYWGNQKG